MANRRAVFPSGKPAAAPGGRRTIHEILAAAARSTTASGRSPADIERFARTLFEPLVNRDFLAFGVTGQT